MLTAHDIRAIRDAMKLDRTPFAAMLGVSESTVARWELGNRHPRWEQMEKLNALAKEKGIPIGVQVAPAAETAAG